MQVPIHCGGSFPRRGDDGAAIARYFIEVARGHASGHHAQSL
ncbi:hypothetical protein [Enterobacter sp. 56-7]|nr:hypothetical protein [Enterobacter sp. 56-7]